MYALTQTLRRINSAQVPEVSAWEAIWRREKAGSSSSLDWKEEIKKGYFDDFGQMNKHKGKLFDSEAELLPVEHSKQFPVTQFMDPNSRTVQFPEKAPDKSPQVACISFREGAKDMVQSWIAPLHESSCPCDIIRIGIVEHRLMAWWPFRSIIVSSGQADSHARRLFHFGDCRSLCTALDITNKLTAYIFLIDLDNRIRWRACGTPTADEIQSLKHFCASLSQKH